MYPKWVEEVSHTPCAACHAVAASATLSRSALRTPASARHASARWRCSWPPAPVAGGRMFITLREPIQSVILALREFVRLADEEGRKTRPPFNFGVGNPLNADDARRENQPTRRRRSRKFRHSSAACGRRRSGADQGLH